MARPLPKIGNKEKALIHVAKAQLGLSDDDYRAILAGVGAASSKDLNSIQFDEVMRRLQSVGFKPLMLAGRRRSQADPKRPLLKKIAAILADSGLSESYANGVSMRMFGVQSYLWLSHEQLWKVAAALSIYQKRRQKTPNPQMAQMSTDEDRS